MGMTVVPSRLLGEEPADAARRLYPGLSVEDFHWNWVYEMGFQYLSYSERTEVRRRRGDMPAVFVGGPASGTLHRFENPGGVLTVLEAPELRPVGYPNERNEVTFSVEAMATHYVRQDLLNWHPVRLPGVVSQSTIGIIVPIAVPMDQRYEQCARAEEVLKFIMGLIRLSTYPHPSFIVPV